MVGALACWLVLSADPVAAGPGDGSGTGSGGSAEDVIAATVTYTTGGGSGGGGDGCKWTLVDGGISVPDVGTAVWPRTDDAGVIHHLWERRCGDFSLTWWDFPEATPADLLPSLLEQLRQTVLPKPEPVFELLDPEFGWAYVRTPLDFRAGGGSWRTVSVTASIGPIWATAMARPTSLRFEPGDPAGPGVASCTGDGPVAPYFPEEPGVCSYTYLNASSTSPYDGYHFLTSLSIDWSITWTSSTGAGGPLPSYSTSSTAELAVAEVKGLVVCTGPRPEQGGC